MIELLKEEKARREATRELIRRGDFLLFQKHIFATVYNKPFKHSWYHELIAAILTNVINGIEKRVIISLPPRYFKTEQTVRMFIPLAHGLKPKWKFQYITYGSELTEDTSTDVKTNMLSSEYKRIFPHVKFNDMQSKKSNWKLESMGEFFGTSVGGVITGKGSHVTVIDDPLKAMDADSKAERDAVMKFYRGSVITRLEDDGAIVIIMQRLHEDDLVGQLIKEQGLKENGGVWTYVSLPILNEEKQIIKYGDFEYEREANEPLNVLIHNHKQIEQLKREMGQKEFQKQYMQDPENKESGHFKKEDITYITDIDLPEQNLYISVDTAESTESSADDRAMAVVGWSVNDDAIEQQVIMDGKRGKWDVYGVCEHLIELMIKYPHADVEIEGAGGGITLEVVLKKEILKANAKLRAKNRDLINNGVRVYKPNNKISKQAKIKYMTAPYENHTIKIHKSCDADFRDKYIDELLRFDPERKGQKDNCIDAVASTWLFAVPKRVSPTKKEQNIVKLKKTKTRWRGV
jgi:hypothetical protein